MSKHDIVYILKNDYDTDEIRYSLRSVVMNFPYRKIVFVGGCPKGIRADIVIPDQQEGYMKADRAMHSLKVALQRDDLTEDIWLFNDDFFVMDKVREDINYFNGTLEKRVNDIKSKKGYSDYCRSLDLARGQLAMHNKDSLSFALHVPMLINRANALQLFRIFPGLRMFRSLYGNYYEIDCRYMKDVKVLDNETIPDTAFISTSDTSFKNGKVGEFLRQYFNQPSDYEFSEEELLRMKTKERFDEEGDIQYE